MFSREVLPNGAPVGKSGTTTTAVRRSTTSAGFGSPGEDATVKRIDLNDALIRHPQATFVMRATGSAMTQAGIDNGDVLLIDRAIEPSTGTIVIAVVDGELTCRRLWQQGNVTKLTANPDHADIVPAEGAQLEIWGVVTTVIKSLLP